MIIFILLAFLHLIVSKSWPNFILYTREDNICSIPFTNRVPSKFIHNKSSVFLIHGFGDSHVRTKLNVLKDEILSTSDFNIFIVDWEQGSLFPYYMSALENAKIVGQKLAEFIMTNKLTSIHCIGHSLGAHICGFSGKIAKLKRISALDPAAPGFTLASRNERLDKSDADFVDVIHGDSIIGLQTAIGHQDFYPCGGLIQASCLPGGDSTEQSFFVDLFTCSHFRVVDYYIESVNSKCKFKALKCDGFLRYLSNMCTMHEEAFAFMGYHAQKKESEIGTFYLGANKNFPYCIE